MNKLLFNAGDDWSESKLAKVWEEIEIIAKEEFPQLYYYPPEIQVVSAKQMLDAYSSVGLPTYYVHWSFGKEYIKNEKQYKMGHMNLAYELVINSNPCIAYLMEENNLLVQTLVMAHASVGHAAVFTNNYLFKDKTDAGSIVDYMNFAKKFIKQCEEKYGIEEVEEVLDACHALSRYGVDKYPHPKKLSKNKHQERETNRYDQSVKDYDLLWEKVGKPYMDRHIVKEEETSEFDSGKLEEPQENILYFIEKNAPNLPEWKREIIRISRKIAHYFSPQGPSKTLNEGYATFTHYYITNRLYEKGLIDEGSMMEFFGLHSNVIYQPDFNSKYYSGFNPYKLGFSIFMDIKRICEEPTTEDEYYFPDLIGKNWKDEINYAMQNFKDETFILQYLSPKVARDFKLFSVNDPGYNANEYIITEISNERCFRELRSKLASQYAMENLIPDIQIVSVDNIGDRHLKLKHFVKNDKPLELEATKEVIKKIAQLWEYTVSLDTIEYNEDGEIGEIELLALGKYS